jgi:cyclopropane-fatty-acyl-phospholipid synthase
MNIIPLPVIRNRFLRTLERLEAGSLTLIEPDGAKHSFKGKEPGPDATWTLHSWEVLRNAMQRGDIALGEDYIAGNWESDCIEALFSVFLLNMDVLEEDYAHGSWISRMGFNLYNRFVRRNNRNGSRQNIEAHYDVGNDFYRLWLDETMTYSSALYKDGNTDLVAAQRDKYGRMLERTADADSVLEIGCGWGGFAAEAVKQSRKVTGLTISPSQHRFATERLGGKADIRLQDYRDTQGLFDSIVSIEMFEAVGERYWPSYFKTVGERLKRGGRAVIQTITVRDDLFDGYRSRSDFIRHYVFPGGMLPSAGKFVEAAAKSGLKCLDVYAFGQDYAQTLREWSKRFEARRDAILGMGYNEAFIRNWRFYLGICAASFAVERTSVVQVELAHA